MIRWVGVTLGFRVGATVMHEAILTVTTSMLACWECKKLFFRMTMGNVIESAAVYSKRKSSNPQPCDLQARNKCR